MTKNFITVADELVEDVVLIKENSPYKNGERAKNKETFSSFRFEGVVFTVPTNSPFIKDYRDGNVASIKLEDKTRVKESKDANGATVTATVRSFEFDSHRTLTAQFTRAKHSAKMAQLVMIGSTENLTEAQVAMLESAI